MTTTIRPVGEAALLLDCADLAAAVGLAERIETARTGAVDVVAAARTVLVTARDAGDLPRLRRTVEGLIAGADLSPSRNPLLPGTIRYPNSDSKSCRGVADPGAGAGVVALDVRYDGPDLRDVADLAGVSVEALVRQHTGITWRAVFGGFAPGFFYLVDERELAERELAERELVDRELVEREPGGGADAEAGGSLSGRAIGGTAAMPTVPRLGAPRPKVPAGSVAVADRFCAVYPGASPGGWRLIGTTDAVMWDLERPQPALLAPGMRVRFREVGGRGVGDSGARDGGAGAGRAGAS